LELSDFYADRKKILKSYSKNTKFFSKPPLVMYRAKDPMRRVWILKR